MRRFILKLDNGVKLTIKPPTLRMYYKGLLNAKTDPQLFAAIADICNVNDENIPVSEEYVVDNFNVDDFSRFMKDFPAWISRERDSDPNS